MKTSLFLIFLSAFLSAVCSTPDYSELEKLLENIAQEDESSIGIDDLEFLANNPLVLKTTSAEELSQIPGISFFLAESIIVFVKNNSVIDYKIIKDSLRLSSEQDFLLRLCTVIEEKQKAKKHNVYFRSRSTLIASQTNERNHDNYTGSKPSFYNRADFFSQNIKAGFIIDKDAFEQSFTDYYSFWTNASYGGYEVNIGDFSIENGMGSLLWSNFGIMKGAMVITPVLQKGAGAKPYRSSVDNYSMRGATLTKKWMLSPFSKLTTLLWASKTPKSGNLNADDQITSLYSSGLFRTETEIAKQNTFTEKTIGGNIQWTLPIFTFGATGFWVEYDKEIVSVSQSAFKGKMGMLSSFYSYVDYRNISLGMELANDARNNLGFKSGAKIFNKDYEAGFHFRHFPSDYRSPYTYNFGESYMPANETGLYSALKWKKWENIDLNFYVDIYKGSDVGYNLDSPIRGFDVFSSFDWKIKNNLISLQLKNEEKTSSVSIDGSRRNSIQKTRRSIRLEHRIDQANKYMVRFRAESCFVDFENAKQTESGYAGFAEIRYNISNDIQIGGRYSLFFTQSYESAIWQYESFIPGAMYSSAMYGSGMRVNLFFSIRLIEKLRIWGRYYETTKNNVDKLGSGLTEIPGNSDRRLSVQLDFNF